MLFSVFNKFSYCFVIFVLGTGKIKVGSITKNKSLMFNLIGGDLSNKDTSLKLESDWLRAPKEG